MVTLSSTDRLHPPLLPRRRVSRMDRHGVVVFPAPQAGMGAPGLDLRPRLDDSLHHDGNCRMGRVAQDRLVEADRDLVRTARSQCSMDSHLLRAPSARLGLCGDRRPLGCAPRLHDPLCTRGTLGGVDDRPVSPLGFLRRGSEFRYLAGKRVSARPAVLHCLARAGATFTPAAAWPPSNIPLTASSLS